MKRGIPIAITAFVGATLVLSFYIPRSPFDDAERLIPQFFNIVAAFAFILGGGNLLRVHLTKISRRDHEWGFSIVTVVGLALMR